MTWNEFDALNDEQLTDAINELLSYVRGLDEAISERGYRSSADDYMGSEEWERLDTLLAEAARRGLILPDDEQEEEDIEQ
jgi:hypothetical protein